ncbi:MULTISPECIES: DNA polymerase Y family protein [Actinoalloteichus]|uniref:DNA-directed DNA polymerase n=1 Tax=Actinoalloteichus fjordicus TaxID=1612552 RepID=A0AAC9LJM1_9PSEU|nr:MULTISPECIES: DNA polymerase Y family protein [Actinoalloteichus]APU17530.1 DNA-directed DNA polymerase [Actinoalloteichus fjordicus]APU23607.1 DNA-directed DNA polymerase [Actinoalloteichus sp. GBA129-24]
MTDFPEPPAMVMPSQPQPQSQAQPQAQSQSQSQPRSSSEPRPTAGPPASPGPPSEAGPVIGQATESPAEPEPEPEPFAGTPLRLLVLWCPDWPVVAACADARLPPETPAAVLAANRVLACSTAARADGVRRGARKRDAQSRCPDLVVLPADEARDARLFEPVASAVEELVVSVEIVRPGVIAIPVARSAGYFGGEESLAEQLVDVVAARAGVECQVGVADGLFAATLAARRGLLIPPGDTPAFLAPLPAGELIDPADRREERERLVDLLRRLGLRTLGDFAELAAADVASRFGVDAILAHRLARGMEERPPALRRTPVDSSVTQEFDPPVERVDAAAFAARALAERLYADLVERGLACTRLGIVACTEHGEELTRLWRCAEPLTSAGIADRVRWQLDGWLRRTGSRGGDGDPDGETLGTRTAPRDTVEEDGPTAGLVMLRLEPAELVGAGRLQLDLFSAGDRAGTAADRAGRALVRVQGLLGPDSVLTPVLGGGRGPREQVRLVPWGDELTPGLDPNQPWPGRLPAPSPSLLPDPPTPVRLLDAAGGSVGVTGRYVLTAPPNRLIVGTDPALEVLAWAGPWPVEERWWTTAFADVSMPASLGRPEAAARRVARLQVITAAGRGDTGSGAYLLARERGGWFIEGRY